jgi:hypothetical protein
VLELGAGPFGDRAKVGQLRRRITALPLGFSDLAAAELAISSDTRSPAKTLRISRRRTARSSLRMRVADTAVRDDVSTREVLLTYPLSQERD